MFACLIDMVEILSITLSHTPNISFWAILFFKRRNLRIWSMPSFFPGAAADMVTVAVTIWILKSLSILPDVIQNAVPFTERACPSEEAQ